MDVLEREKIYCNNYHISVVGMPRCDDVGRLPFFLFSMHTLLVLVLVLVLVPAYHQESPPG